MRDRNKPICTKRPASFGCVSGVFRVFVSIVSGTLREVNKICLMFSDVVLFSSVETILKVTKNMFHLFLCLGWDRPDGQAVHPCGVRGIGQVAKLFFFTP